MTQFSAQGIPFADAWSMHDGGVGSGWVVMTLGMIAFFVVLSSVCLGAETEQLGDPAELRPDRGLAADDPDRRQVSVGR